MKKHIYWFFFFCLGNINLTAQNNYNFLQASIINPTLTDSLGKVLGDDKLVALVDSSLNVQSNLFDFKQSDETFARDYLTQCEIFASAKYYRPNDHLVHDVIANMMLSKFAKDLEAQLAQKQVDADDSFIKYLRQRLAENKMYVNVKTSNYKKIIKYLSEGRFEYVFHKLTTTYLKEFTLLITGAVMLMLLIWFRKNILLGVKNILQKRKIVNVLFRNRGALNSIILPLLPFLLTQKSCTAQPHVTQKHNLVVKERAVFLVEEKLHIIPVPKEEYTVNPVQHSMFKTWTNRKGHKYYFAIINPKSPKLQIDFLWRNKDKIPLGSFENCIKHITKNNANYKPLMCMNLGIFDINQTPLGVLYANGKKLHGINIAKGTGNFYLEPNGVFIIEKSGLSKVLTTEDFMKNAGDTTNIKHATQSGPMLVIKDEINAAFNKNSQNVFIRNGVGVMQDGNIIFIISDEAVSFYEFAEIFRDRFKCENALYLDGSISKLYAPKIQQTSNGGKFSAIIAIGEK